MFARETMTVAKWYGRSVPVPGFDNRSFLPFLVGSVGIVRSVLQDNLGRKIQILFRTVDTAQANQDKGQIVINQEFLRGRFLDKRLSSDETIGAILGIIVHESAHFAFSPATLEPFSKHVKEYGKSVFNDQVARILGNVVEDVYIEAEVDRRVPTLSWMLDHTNRVFFPIKQEEKVIAEALPIAEAPKRFEDVGKVLNVLILAKTRMHVSVNPYVDTLFFLVRKAATSMSLKQRMDLVVVVYDLLMQAVVETKEDEAGESGEGEGESKKAEAEAGEDEGESEGEGGDAPDSGKDALDKSERLAEGLSAKKRTRVPGPSGDWRVTNAEHLLEKMQEDEFKLEGESDDALLVVERNLPIGNPIEADGRYDRLAEIARQRAVVNKPYGMDRNRGTHIRKLYRIATDQKIFAENVTMNSYKPMQVIILLDCSGSMLSGVGSRYSSESMIEAASKATLGAAQGLASARCEVAVYGHTAHQARMGEVDILKGKEFIEPVTVLASRLGGLIYSGDLVENKDGHAIRYVAKKFTTSSKRRLLIVVSDGAPQAPDYYGSEANLHTKNAVDEVRKQGIDVLSISIRESARHTNNYIYGEENNVFNEDPNVIEQVIRALLVK